MPLLLSEQKRFAALLDSLREASIRLEAGALPLPGKLDPPTLVVELGQVLAEHFASADACLRAVPAERLDLLPAVVDLRLDHAALSDALSDLRLLADDEARWPELPLRIASLLKRLNEHREIEAALVRDAARSTNVA
jgi:hypothetical protein